MKKDMLGLIALVLALASKGLEPSEGLMLFLIAGVLFCIQVAVVLAQPEVETIRPAARRTPVAVPETVQGRAGIRYDRRTPGEVAGQF